MQLTDDDARLAQAVRAAFSGSPPPETLGVAVSGGSDSIALLHLLADWAQDGGPAICVATVDHGLRTEAAGEAADVARLCARLGVPHRTLRWDDWDHRGNVMDAARRARLRLIGDWALARGVGVVALGHTADDQAETILMRLGRGSGVDGLSGMAARRQAGGIVWIRPMLDLRRSDLRAMLGRRGARWIEDPSNQDARFDRVKARAALLALEPLGVTTARVLETGRMMALARRALEDCAGRAARDVAVIDAGDVVFARDALLALPLETQLRLVSQAIRWIGSAEYRPRLEALLAVHSGLVAGGRRTLGGCLVTAGARAVRVGREPRAVHDTVAAPGTLWDGRWRVTGPEISGLELRALGAAGLDQCPGWRNMGRPRSSLAASPSVWRGATLIAAPLARHEPDWRAETTGGDDAYFLSLLSH